MELCLPNIFQACFRSFPQNEFRFSLFKANDCTTLLIAEDEKVIQMCFLWCLVFTYTHRTDVQTPT